MSAYRFIKRTVKNPAMSAGQIGQRKMSQQDEINKIVEGQASEEEVKELEAKLSEAGKKELREVLALKEQRKAEEARLATAKQTADEEDGKAKAARESQTQLRTEQISKAKESFFTEYSIPEADRSEYEELFTKVDSGKMDPDLIKQDFIKAYAAKNADVLLKSHQEKLEMEKRAAEANAQGAGSHSSKPGDMEPPKYSDEVKKIAETSNIPVEAADKIAKEGMHRVIG